MMSICLQSMVDELMVKKSGGSIRKVRSGCALPAFCPRTDASEREGKGSGFPWE